MRYVITFLSALLMLTSLTAADENEIIRRYKKELTNPSDGNPTVADQMRATIIWELRQFKTKTSIDALSDAFKNDPSQDVRIYALFALSEIGTYESFCALLEALLYEETAPPLKRRGPTYSAPNNEKYPFIPDAVFGALNHSGNEKLRAPLKRLLEDKTKRTLIPTALKVATEFRITDLDPSLSSLLKEKENRKFLVDILRCIYSVGKEKSLFKEAVATGLEEKESPPRVLAATILRRLSPEDGALEYAKKLLSDKNWQVRSALIETLSFLKHKESIDILISAMPKEEGRLKADIAMSLRKLTGKWFADDEQSWTDWWKIAREDFVFPEKVSDEEEPAQQTPRKNYRTEPAKYYGMEILSYRVCFLIDISGSMEEAAELEIEGKLYKGTKLDIAKGELARCLDKLTQKVKFNIITFHTEFSLLQPKLIKASDEAKKASLNFVSKLSPQMDTNIYDALEAALSDPEVDTVYLLSDGLPNTGKIHTPEGILRKIREVNATRRVVINTIAFGKDAGIDFLKKLAAENRGKFIDMSGKK
ncbi:MAG: HEAT repeat domain-containing protein [Planctomycetota bacterium]|nr:HEAT repeat domain-containing protein [Planctomycetota bacterium]